MGGQGDWQTLRKLLQTQSIFLLYLHQRSGASLLEPLTPWSGELQNGVMDLLIKFLQLVN